MKSILIVCLLGAVTLSMGDTKVHSRGCLYIMGRCVEECPVGTHSYTTGCGYLTPEATCEQPEPKQETRGMICDYSACYCDPGTVRDKKTDKCVTLDKCT